MRDPDREFGEDLDMEQQLRRLADRSRTPPLPPELASLPWTVQAEKSRFGFLRSLRSVEEWPGLFGRAVLATARVGAVVAVSVGLLGVVAGARVAGQPPQDIKQNPTPAPVAADAPEVVLLPTNGVVDDVMAGYIAGGIAKAESDHAAAVIIELDTLGGAESSMMSIVQSLHAQIPTIVWVGPEGAKAASAGTFITLAANLDYMAQSTNIGAASPVAAGGGDIAAQYGQTEADKVMNDAIATIRSIAQERHPLAVDWAVSTVQKAQSYTAQEALAAHAINGIANSIDDVLTQADGQVVTVKGAQVTLHVKGANVVTVAEDPIQAILHSLDDPNIAFILLVVGVLCVIIEFFHPTLLMGLLGAFSLILSFYGAGSLPLNILGVVLVVLGVGMLVFENAVPSHGLMTIGGIVSFVVGAVAFYGSPGPYLPASSVAWPIIVLMAGLAGLYALFLVRTLWRMRHEPVPIGSGMVGTMNVVGLTAVVQRDLSPVGTVYVAGEAWSAKLRGGESVARGSQVKVVGKDGLTLIVEPVG